MSINLLDLVKDQVTGALAKEASSFLGESESGVAKALGGIMPALLGSTIEKASTSNGAASVMDAVSKLDLGQLGDIAGIFKGGPSGVNGVLNSGGGILDMLMGNKSSGIVDLIVNMTGLKNSSVGTLLKLAAPFLLGSIGKQVQGKGIDFLKDLLMGQKSHVASALPAGMGNLLGLGFANDGGSRSTTSTSHTTTSHTTESDGGGGMGWLKWLLPLLLAAGAFMAYKKCKPAGPTAEQIEAAAKATQDSLAAIAAAASAEASKVVSAAQAFADKFKVTLTGAAENGIENQLVGFVNDSTKVVDKTTWFNFDRLLFDTGKATLQASSQEQLKNMAEILKAFPKVKLKIGGYTDNVGKPAANLKLSSDRANTVMGELIKLGVDKARLAAEGYGDQHPVGDNNTEEGRQQNRRIAVRVTEK